MNGHVVAAIIATVADRFLYTDVELLGRSRRQPLAHARQVAMYLCRELTDMSYPQIGRLFDRHHTTVIHAVQERLADSTDWVEWWRNGP